MRRMRFVGLMIPLSVLCALFGGSAQAQVSDGTVKIGVLTDLSGPAATATGPDNGAVSTRQMPRAPQVANSPPSLPSRAPVLGVCIERDHTGACVPGGTG